MARTLVAFEYLWYEAWCKSVESSKAGLQATLIIRHPSNRKLYVNFDQEILQLIRETKCLDRMVCQKMSTDPNDLKFLLDSPSF